MRIEGHLDTHPQGDRRESARRELHLLVASLTGQSPAANVLIRDLSQTGLLLQTSTRLAAGETLQVDLPHTGFQPAEVVWTSGEFVGCRFKRPINTAAVSAARLRSEPSAAIRSLSRLAIGNDVAGENGFGARLRRLRTQYNLSQTALATLLKVTKLSVWKWERGDVLPRAGTVAAMANLFVVSENELLTGTLAPLAEAASGADDAIGAQDGLAAIVEECKARIAEHLGTTPDKVEISVSL